MNFRRLASAVAALAVAGTMCAGLAVTASADDELPITKNYDDEDATVDWTIPNDDDMMTLVDDGNGGKKIQSIQDSTLNGSRGAYIIFGALTAGSQYVVEFDMSFKSGNNQASQFAILGSDYAYTSNNVNYGIASGYALKLTANASASAWSITDSSETIPAGDSVMYHYTVLVDGTKAYLTVTDDEDETVVEQQKLSVNGNGGFAGLYYLSGRYTAEMTIDNIVLRNPYENEIPTTTSYTITTYYLNKDDNSTVIEKTTEEVDEGESYEPTYDEVIYVDEYKYSYDSHTTIESVTADADVYVYYTQSDRGTCTATISSTGVEADDITQTFDEGDTVTLYYPRYIQDGTTVYEANKQSSTPYYGHEFTATETVEVTYSKTYENVVYCDDFDETTYNKDFDIPSYASNGGTYNNHSWSTTLDSGKYEIYAYVHNRNRGTTFNVGGTSIGAFADQVSKYTWGMFTKEFEVTEDDTTIEIASSGNLDPIDTIIIVAVPEIITGVATTADDGSASLGTLDTTKTVTAVTDGVSDKTYGTITDGKTVTTIYARIKNATSGTPTITVTDTDNNVISTDEWTAVANDVYFAQLIGDITKFASVKIEYTDATSVTITDFTESE